MDPRAGRLRRSLPEVIERSSRLESALIYHVLDTIGLPDQQVSLALQPLEIDMVVAGLGVVATVIFVFVWGWTEFLFAVIPAGTDVATLSLVISSFYGTQASIDGAATALALLAMVPVFISALAMQRRLVRGLTLGAMKG